MAWGSKVDATVLTNVSDTESFFDQTPTTTPGELFHAQVQAVFTTSPTDNAVVALYSTLDDSSENWDETALVKFEIDKGTSPNDVSFDIAGVYRWRIGVKSAGTTDNIHTMNMSFRRDNVNI